MQTQHEETSPRAAIPRVAPGVALTLRSHGLARLIGGEGGEQHGADDEYRSSRDAEAPPHVERAPLLVCHIDVRPRFQGDWVARVYWGLLGEWGGGGGRAFLPAIWGDASAAGSCCGIQSTRGSGTCRGLSSFMQPGTVVQYHQIWHTVQHIRIQYTLCSAMPSSAPSHLMLIQPTQRLHGHAHDRRRDGVPGARHGRRGAGQGAGHAGVQPAAGAGKGEWVGVWTGASTACA